MPALILAPLLYALSLMAAHGGPPATGALYDFDAPSEVRWQVVNDGVMGGRSTGRVASNEPGILRFSGDLSLENNGGFSQIRTNVAGSEFKGADGVEIRVRGDGREYQLRLRTTDAFDGVAYRQHFKTTPGEWVEFEAAYEDFLPVIRGRLLSNAPALDADSIRQVGFMIADKTAGPFRLEIDWIKARD